MLALVARRLMTAIPTLLAIILASFFLMRLAPGGPFDGERPFAAGDTGRPAICLWP